MINLIYRDNLQDLIDNQRLLAAGLFDLRRPRLAG